MDTPTIGRIVHFHPNERRSAQLSEGQFAHPVTPGEPLAAIVTAVHSPTCVNLVVMTASGPAPMWFNSVELDPGLPAEEGHLSYWAWPPRV